MENTNTSIFNWERAQELMDNIKRMNDLLAVHTQADSSDLIIYQYEEKRDASGEFATGLQHLLKGLPFILITVMGGVVDISRQEDRYGGLDLSSH